jgi:uncharacterized protein YndB with AHSA1/START domain/DNA-binding transcriptional ArsR family regulator
VSALSELKHSDILEMDNNISPLGNIFQALADPTRRAVIQRLGIGPASTKELAAPFNMALPSFMQHLTMLENSGLIASKKVGRVRAWQIDEESLVAVESWIHEQRAVWEGRADRFTSYVEALYKKEMAMLESTNDFIVSRFIRAPRHVLWQAWTIPEHLEKWWVPKPMTCKVMSFDPRPSGAFHLLMRDPGGNEMPQTGAFLDIVPGKRLIFTTALTSEWRPANSYLPITAIISMADESGGTRYETRVLYKNEEERQQLGEMHFESGWSTAIDQLNKFVTEVG